MKYDLVIHDGLVFDGHGGEGKRADVGIRSGHVVEVAPSLSKSEAKETLDAKGAWVMPGFVDNHTHYDAEVLLAPGLGESVRHGVTTICMGSCSLSTIYANQEQCADIFSRVEAVPREHVLKALGDKPWNDAASYAAHLDSLPLGPNVACYLGHSDLRVATMGLSDATTRGRRPSPDELNTMTEHLEHALDEGFLGLSTMTNPWDKVGGDSESRSNPLPSTFASWREYGAFHSVLRRRGAVLQSAPNITTKWNVLLFFLASASLGFRKALKTTLITIADGKANPFLARAIKFGTNLWNRLFGSNLRFQGLPIPFEVYADGIDLVVFEEFGAGEEALDLVEQTERNALFADPAYRRRFRRDYDRRFGPRVWQRDFHDAEIVSAPDPSLAGRTFGAIADERGEHPVDTFLDLVMEHGKKVRWRTTIANHRPDVLAEIVADPAVQVGFSDAGAHLRNMGFYNFPLHLLRMAKERGPQYMTIGRAVHRVTAEIAEWLGLDAGSLQVGDRADIAIVNPNGLDESLDAYREAPVEVYGGLSRQVRRNDQAVRATVIGGEVVFEDGQFREGFGKERAHGRFLRREAKTPARTTQSESITERAA